jgi:hypothetical protein
MTKLHGGLGKAAAIATVLGAVVAGLASAMQ